jgi:hypothetical protein
MSKQVQIVPGKLAKQDNCPPHLREFWHLFEPLTHSIDPLQLWHDTLDVMIGSFQITSAANVLPDFSENRLVKDYDRAVLGVGHTPKLREELNKMIHAIYKAVATHNSNNKKLPYDTATYITHACMSPYRAETKGRWLDFFGDFHYWLQAHFDRSALTPCAADVSITIEWTKAQLKGVALIQDGQPVSINNRLIMANLDCGSGRSTLAHHGLHPGCFDFTCESTDILHCKYTVLNMMLHGIAGQVTLVNPDNRQEHVRTWDVNRWLFHRLPPVAGLSTVPHVFDAPTKLSRSYHQLNDEEGNASEEKHNQVGKLKMEMLNRLSDGLGIGLQVEGDTNFMVISEKPKAATPPVAAPNGKAKNLVQRLLQNQLQQQKKTAPVAPVVPVPEPVTPEPVPVAATERPRSMARRRG